MTSRVTKDVPVTEESTDSPAAKEWGSVELLGRKVAFNPPTPEQLMVLRRLSRQLDDSGNNAGKTLVIMAKILDAVSACMIDDETIDYVDDLVLSRKIGVDELIPLILMALIGEEGQKARKTAAPKNGPVRRVRRR